MTTNKYNYITRGEQLQQYVGPYKQEKHIALDIKLMGGDPQDQYRGKIRLIQIASPTLPVLIIDWARIDDTGKLLMKELLEASMVKIIHNAKAAMKYLNLAGINLNGAIFDTFLADEILGDGLIEHDGSLPAVVKKYLNVSLPTGEYHGTWGRPELTTRQLDSAATDVLVLLLLRPQLIEELKVERLVKIAKLKFDAIWLAS
ncbi:hypothetical protein [uncultured Acetobacterium sp.]|uniref:hypothetical protein n=1 Tax=uncultured Acetobacterium sp. TaxID=217139 RepID=UPI0025D2B1D4|nr:hypothetical protein [uncultured Acetobacterium sp.]